MMFYNNELLSPIQLEEDLTTDVPLFHTIEGERIAELESLIDEVKEDIEFVLTQMVIRANTLKSGLDAGQAEDFAKAIRHNLKRFGSK